MTEPWHVDDSVTVYAGDCLDIIKELPDASIDSVVTDPPYAIGFMGKEWDKIGDSGRGARARTERATEVTPTGEGHTTSAGPYLAAGVDSLRSAGKPFQAWCELWAAECLRVLKPGGHMLTFGGTRTAHRLGCAIEDAGFEIRDSIAWMYGSGFPKSLDVSKAIDRAAGAEREVVAERGQRFGLAQTAGWNETSTPRNGTVSETAPSTDAAKRWEGWGTALKPAHEPIVVARKPLVGTVAGNVLAHGTGALNIGATRIVTTDDLNGGAYAEVGGRKESASLNGGSGMNVEGKTVGREFEQPAGRWPANVVLDEGQAAELDRQSGVVRSAGLYDKGAEGVGAKEGPASIPIDGLTSASYDDIGGAARFFYVAKANSGERPSAVDVTAHPTVKPLALMRWLVRLVTPPGGVVLDPFLGSGTTAEACIVEGFRCVGIERETDYLPLIKARITKPIAPVMF